MVEKIDQHYDEGRSKRSGSARVGGGANGKGGAAAPSDGVVVAMRDGLGGWVGGELVGWWRVGPAATCEFIVRHTRQNAGVRRRANTPTYRNISAAVV